MSAVRMLTMCRLVESVRPFVRLYSLTMRSPPGFLDSTDSTNCGKNRTEQKYIISVSVEGDVELWEK